MTAYSHGKIYQIVCGETGEVYIGSTCQKTLAMRLSAHVNNFKWKKAGKTNSCTTSFSIIERGNYNIELIEMFPCESRDELRARESHFIRERKCVNKVIPRRTTKEWYQDNKEAYAEKNKAYRLSNKESITEKAKDFYSKNKEKFAEHNKEYYQANKAAISKKTKEYRTKNKEKYAEYGKAYYQERKAKVIIET